MVAAGLQDAITLTLRGSISRELQPSPHTSSFYLAFVGPPSPTLLLLVFDTEVS